MTLGWVTLDCGEQALVYSLRGNARTEVGPKRMFLWREKFIPLRGYHANQSEYLVIRHQDGLVTHQPGPCAIFMNPLKHKDITLKSGISLDANEILVIYKLDQKSGDVTRYLKHGPTLYIPDANEWLHNFAWHGTNPKNKTQMLPGERTFSKLKVIPDQFYYNVDEVRTADDALMRVKLMIFYEFKNLEQMLNSTADPIADFINCVTADLIVFASKLTYMEFIEKSGELNDFKNYPQLEERCKLIGAEVSKVAFRGYYASPKLQQTHDNAIQSRNLLKMQYERVEQEQVLTDMNMKNEQSRAELEQNMEIQTLEHEQEIERSETNHKLTLYKQDRIENIERLKKEQQAKLEEATMENKHKLTHYEELHKLSVDLTEYLMSQHPQPSKVVKVVADHKAAIMHFHHN